MGFIPLWWFLVPLVSSSVTALEKENPTQAVHTQHMYTSSHYVMFTLVVVCDRDTGKQPQTDLFLRPMLHSAGRGQCSTFTL